MILIIILIMIIIIIIIVIIIIIIITIIIVVIIIIVIIIIIMIVASRSPARAPPNLAIAHAPWAALLLIIIIMIIIISSSIIIIRIIMIIKIITIIIAPLERSIALAWVLVSNRRIRYDCISLQMTKTRGLILGGLRWSTSVPKRSLRFSSDSFCCRHAVPLAAYVKVVIRTCHILPPSEIDWGLCLAVFAGSEGTYLFHRSG